MSVLAVAAHANVARACGYGETDCAECQDHVQPFSDPDGYFSALKTLLIGDGDAYVIWASTFLPEYAVSLHRQGDAWRVRLASAQEPVWNWTTLPGGKTVQAFRTQQSVDLRERDFPADLANDLVRAWRDVLARTRAQPTATTTTDGFGYVFSAGGLVGQDANLRCGIGDEMMRTAVDLARYARASDPLSRWSIRVRLQREVGRIERNEYSTVPKD